MEATQSNPTPSHLVQGKKYHMSYIKLRYLRNTLKLFTPFFNDIMHWFYRQDLPLQREQVQLPSG